MRTLLIFPLLALTAVGCAKCAPGTVGAGVSRLTIRNFGAIVTLVKEDTNCGFASEAVINAPEFSGPLGTEGSATWTVRDCLIEIPEATPIVSSDCAGTEYTVSGTLLVSAMQTVHGVLAGATDKAVIPTGPDAATIHVQRAQFENFVVRQSGNGNALTMIGGALRGTVSPRLAVDAVNGACSIATKHATFSDIVYEPSLLHVATPDREFDVEVQSSNISAVHGRVGEQENVVWGTITVWDSEQQVPPSGDDDGLDPTIGCSAVFCRGSSFALPTVRMRLKCPPPGHERSRLASSPPSLRC